MPWSNQGGGPWGSGGSKGPWGSGPQSSGTDPARPRRASAPQPGQAEGFLPGGNLGGRGVLLIVLAAIVVWGFSGFFRVEPDELGVVLRFGQYTRDAKPGLNYHLPYPVETVVTPEGHAGQPHRHRHAADRRLAPRRHPDARRAGRKPDAHRRREYRRCRLLGVLAGQDRRRRRLPVQHPESGRHRESGRRKRDARGGGPLGNPADPHRRAADHRDRRS